MRHASGDRRLHARFEVLGRVWGTLETVLNVRLLNISRGGALVECPVPLEPNSVHKVSVTRGEVQAAVEVRVRHAEHSDHDASYRIGVEFIGLSSAMRALLDGAAEPESSNG